MQHDYSGSPVAAQDCTEILGTPFKVLLSNGVTVSINNATKKEMVEIVDLPGLIAAVIQARVLHPRKLSGDDLKYIRSALCLRSNEVAASLDLSAEHYSRCESGTKTLSTASERQYRMEMYLTAGCRDIWVQDQISRSQEEKKKINPEAAQKVIHAFRTVFHEMKIYSVRVADQGLEFLFTREPPRECINCGEEWQSGVDQAAA